MNMRSFRCAMLMSLVSIASVAHAAGGPDAFGYTWLSSGEPGGPVFSWVDISTTGTLVTGLGDDNATPSLPLPLPFRYYWTDVSQFVVGSNGWIGMQPTSNIAHCFPNIPQAGGIADAYIAAYMSDLNFNGVTNPGSVRTFFDTLTNRFIVSYLNVPFWVAGTPDFTGSNTFQVIFDYMDNSITVQFLAMSTFSNQGGCNQDASMGIEAPQGSIGLTAFGEITPGNNTAWRFEYPAVPLISVIDPAPAALLNDSSAAVFVHANDALTLDAVISNSGNAMTTSAVDVRAEVLTTDTSGSSLYDQTITLPSLDMNQQVAVDFVPDYMPVPGPQVLRVRVSGGGDINAGNNEVVSEIRGLTLGAPNQTLGYINGNAADGTLNWNGASGDFGFGAAVLIVPPSSNYLVNNLQAFVTGFSSTNLALDLRDNDGPDGSPGTSLGLLELDQSMVQSNAWNTLSLPAPVAVDGDGFYLVWYQRGTTLLLGTVSNQLEPVSRRGYELLGGTFSAWRTNATADLMLRVNASSLDILPDDLFANGFE